VTPPANQSARAPRGSKPGPGKGVWVAWLGIALVVVLFALPEIHRLGLYYDEAFLAQQARDFVEPESAGQHPASVRTWDVFGRPFPLRNAVYLGSLKSQLLIPVLALAGSSPRAVRTATLSLALLALGLSMFWVARIFGDTAAVVMGVLVACDPTFYFLAQFEWGPFTTNFLCRAGGALLITGAWQSPSRRRGQLAALAGGALLGLGVFSRADFILIPASAGLALLICRPDLVREALTERRDWVIAAGAAFLFAALPMILSAWALLDSTGATGGRGDLLFRAQVLWQSLDGSQFLRLMKTGGLFEKTPTIDAPGGLLGWALVPALIIVGFDLLRPGRRERNPRRDPRAFLLLFALFLTAFMLALPGAVRAHHQLNTLPLLHLIVACAGLAAWRWKAPGGRSLLRVPVVVLFATLVAANVLVIRETSAFIADTGGRGRFSHALDDFALAVDAQPGKTVVSLDWGFHEPLLFLTRQTRLVESIWSLPQQIASGRPWVFAGSQDTVYLVHDVPHDLFGLGPKLLVAARLAGSEKARITPHRDGGGELAFYSVEFLGPHSLRYDGRFRFR
jgi:hypothetical protein